MRSVAWMIPWLVALALACLAAEAGIPPGPGIVVEELYAPGDTAIYRISWSLGAVDATYPTPTFWHWQLVLGDTVPKQPLNRPYSATGVTWGYVNAVQWNSEKSLRTMVDTIYVARPTVGDSTGPFRLAVQAGVASDTLAGTPVSLGPYAMTSAWHVKRKQLLPNAPQNLRADSIGLAFVPDSLASVSLVAVRPVVAAFSAGATFQLCAFGQLSNGTVGMFPVSDTIPYCQDQYAKWLTERAG